jgi:hypothetical protein
LAGRAAVGRGALAADEVAEPKPVVVGALGSDKVKAIPLVKKLSSVGTDTTVIVNSESVREVPESVNDPEVREMLMSVGEAEAETLSDAELGGPASDTDAESEADTDAGADAEVDTEPESELEGGVYIIDVDELLFAPEGSSPRPLVTLEETLERAGLLRKCPGPPESEDLGAEVIVTDKTSDVMVEKPAEEEEGLGRLEMERREMLVFAVVTEDIDESEAVTKSPPLLLLTLAELETGSETVIGNGRLTVGKKKPPSELLLLVMASVLDESLLELARVAELTTPSEVADGLLLSEAGLPRLSELELEALLKRRRRSPR